MQLYPPAEKRRESLLHDITLQPILYMRTENPCVHLLRQPSLVERCLISHRYPWK